MKEKKLTQERVVELFRYDDGDLTRRVAIGSRGEKGDSAGTTGNHGYLVTNIDGKAYYNHRIIWLLHYGYLPEHGLDHIDRDQLNNRVENLREVSQKCNQRNTGNRITNTSGVKGVSRHGSSGKWLARITINNKLFYLGLFGEIAEAAAHRLAAEQCVGWDGCDSSSPAYQYMADYLKTT